MSESINIDLILPEDLLKLFSEASGMNLAFVFSEPPDEAGNCDTRLLFAGTDIKAWVGDAAKAGEEAGFKKGLESGRREIIEQLMWRPSG